MDAVERSMITTCRVLLVSGSLRTRSTNTAVLRTGQAIAPPGIDAVLYGGLGDLPHFNPDDDLVPLQPAAADLRSHIRLADAVLFSTPEYAGALPGSFKNLLDWTVGDNLVGSIYEKPVAWINASPRGALDAHDSLRRVLGHAHAAIIEAACAEIPVTQAMVDNEGLIADVSIRSQIVGVLTVLSDQVCRERSGRGEATA